jgi:hypothetical protein
LLLLADQVFAKSIRRALSRPFLEGLLALPETAGWQEAQLIDSTAI